MDRLGHHATDAFDMLQFFHRIAGLHAVQERVQRQVMAGDDTGRGLADMADAQRVDQPVQPDAAARLDPRHEVGDDLVFFFFLLLRCFYRLFSFGGAALFR